MNHEQYGLLGLSYKGTLLWGLLVSLVVLTFIFSCNSNKLEDPIRPKKKIESIVTQVKYYKNYRVDEKGLSHYTEPIKKEKALTSLHYRLHYDQNNHVIKEEEYDEKGRLKRYSNISYQNGMKFHEEVYTGSNDLIFSRYYDSKEILAKEEKYSHGQLLKYVDFTYDKKGYKKKEKHYRSDEVLELFKTFKYNDKNQLIQVDTHLPQGRKSIVHQYVVYRYNDKGVKKKERYYALRYSPNGKSQKYLLIKENTYTPKGIQVTVIQYDQNSKVLKKDKYLYNAQGEEIKPVAERSGDTDENLKSIESKG